MFPAVLMTVSLVERALLVKLFYEKKGNASATVRRHRYQSFGAHAVSQQTSFFVQYCPKSTQKLIHIKSVEEQSYQVSDEKNGGPAKVFSSSFDPDSK
ncbi:hypothetical protein TNCV_2534291 [Trichonephila clavipes]|nr:hypothetical protein TNCV_2534291 [Trichonephila clavipes]